MVDLLPNAERPAWLLLIPLLLFAGEYMVLRWQHKTGYDWSEAFGSTAVAIIGRGIRSVNFLLLLPALLWVGQFRVFDWTIDSVAQGIAVLLIVDFSYYWMHRAMHRVRWFWATHAVHHSTTRINLTAAYRLGWTDLISGTWLFFVPAVLLGIPPVAVLLAFGANLLYQFFLHTEAIGRLGPLEWVLNTPHHHRMHHAHNEGCLDRNFGGILIVWDRLFGTLASAPKEQPLEYGLLGVKVPRTPWGIAFVEWRRLIRDMAQAGGLRAAWRVAAGRP